MSPALLHYKWILIAEPPGKLINGNRLARPWKALKEWWKPGLGTWLCVGEAAGMALQAGSGVQTHHSSLCDLRSFAQPLCVSIPEKQECRTPGAVQGLTETTRVLR